jgi:hypothetical protein
MNHRFTHLCLGLVAITMVASCKKDYNNPTPQPPAPTRTIKYLLYTLQDFGGDNDTITFTLRLSSQNGRLFDSTLSPMRISEIPDKPHTLAIDRVVPAGLEKDTLRVGFVYEIKNVGVGSFIDTCAPGQTLKRVEYNFQ